VIPDRPRRVVERYVSRVVRGVAVTEGAGVEITRLIGQPALSMLDPFLLLDEFRSDRPDDYPAYCTSIRDDRAGHVRLDAGLERKP